MKLIERETDREYSLSELRDEWITFRSEEPWNHAETFTVELYEILMATINGRNDCDIVGLTVREICDYIIRLRHKLTGA